MLANRNTKTGGLSRRRSVSPLLRTASAGLAALFLATPFAHAMDRVSLSRQNQVAAPFPSSYTKEALAKVAHKMAVAYAVAVAQPPAAKPVVVAAARAPKRSVMEIALQERINPTVYDQMERTAIHEAASPLVEAIIGDGHPTGPHSKLKLGYGKMVADNSGTVGLKNGTRLEEPGCLYVKTTVNF